MKLRLPHAVLLSLLATSLALHAAPPAKAPAATPPPATPPPATPAPAPEAPLVLAPEDLVGFANAIGKQATVEGTIARAGESKSKTVHYLNFSTAIGSTISLVFLPKGEPVTMEKLQEYVGKRIRATGLVGEYQERVQLQIDKLSQITVLP